MISNLSGEASSKALAKAKADREAQHTWQSAKRDDRREILLLGAAAVAISSGEIMGIMVGKPLRSRLFQKCTLDLELELLSSR